jgi:hypothetical protein
MTGSDAARIGAASGDHEATPTVATTKQANDNTGSPSALQPDVAASTGAPSFRVGGPLHGEALKRRFSIVTAMRPWVLAIAFLSVAASIYASLQYTPLRRGILNLSVRHGGRWAARVLSGAGYDAPLAERTLTEMQQQVRVSVWKHWRMQVADSHVRGAVRCHSRLLAWQVFVSVLVVAS